MDRIELHDMEYGAAAALVGRDQSALLVDCGSVSRFTRAERAGREARFASFFARYARARRREFLLTHYHSDHLNGFLYELRRDPRYFDRVYLPALPFDADGESPFLRLAVFSHFFSAPQGYFARVNTACLVLLQLLWETAGAGKTVTLAAGDAFLFDGTAYRVLSPAADFPLPETLVSAAEQIKSEILALRGGAAFCAAADAYIAGYGAAQAALRPGSGLSPEAKARRLDRLAALWEELKSKKPAGPAGQISASLEAVRAAYTETQNALSLVFHDENASDGGVLVTGDATPEVLDALAPKLHSRYRAVFAPHHGTQSHVSPALLVRPTSHYLISNGEYHAGGEISAAYRESGAICHCTNCNACPAAGETGCCNRLNRCGEQASSGALALRCPAARGGRRTPCNIYVFGHSGVSGCLCDLRRR